MARIGTIASQLRARWAAPDDELTATALLLLLVWSLLRVELLVQASITLADTPGYRPIGGAWTVWAAAAVVSVLVLAGGVRAGGMRPAHAWVDLGVAVSGILILAQLCPPGHGADMPLLWMLPFGQGSVVALTMARTRLITGAVGTAVIMGAYLLAVSLHLSAADLPASAAANTISFALFYAVAAAAVTIAWRMATRASEQRLVNLAQQRDLAALSERARQFRLIHDSVLQTLEALSHRFIADPEQVQHVARIEAARLRAMLAAAGNNSEPGSLLNHLRCVAAEFPDLTVEIVDLEASETPEGAEPGRAPALSAVTDAVRELLNNVTKHAACTQATVSLCRAPEGAVEVVVRDHGVGFDPTQVDQGFGLHDSVIGRIAEAGGSVQIWSKPGAGTRVTITCPATAAPHPASACAESGSAILPYPHRAAAPKMTR
ncbi:MAG: ATP-binding protein [Jatrophihabitans sp.]